MNSRQRVRAVINHQLPDRVPNGLGGCETAGLHVLAYGTLQKLLGAGNAPPRVNTFMANAVFEEDVLRAIQGDILLIASPRMCKAPLRGSQSAARWREQALWGKTFRVPVGEAFSCRPDGTLVWETAGGVVCPPGSFYFDSDRPLDLLAEIEIPDPEDYHPPEGFTDDFLRGLERTAKTLYSETEYALCLGETLTDLQLAPGGQVGLMVLMKQAPQVLHALLDKAVRGALKQLEQLEQAVGRYVDILCIAHDFGDNRGVTIGEALWREIYKPHYRALFGGWRRRTGMKVMLHSCGAVHALLDDLIECGVDIFNPVQLSACGMEPAGLKARFGGRLVFWGGGYDAQLVHEDESCETVYEKVRQNLAALKAGGGYIFAGVHNLPARVPAGHLQAMLNAWRDGREY